jgi:hypothetical protein
MKEKEFNILDTDVDQYKLAERASSTAAHFALLPSIPLALRYLSEHVQKDVTPSEVIAIAIAQLEDLMEPCRTSLSGIFTLDDFHELLDLKGGHLRPLLNHTNLYCWYRECSGLEHYEIKFEQLPELAKKLSKLTHLQGVTLWDVLQRLWASTGVEIAPFICSLDIDLIA